jgi:hypothetical protein
MSAKPKKSFIPRPEVIKAPTGNDRRLILRSSSGTKFIFSPIVFGRNGHTSRQGLKIIRDGEKISDREYLKMTRIAREMLRLNGVPYIRLSSAKKRFHSSPNIPLKNPPREEKQQSFNW